MNIPVIVLKKGDTVDFYKMIGKEEVEFSGTIVSVSKSDEASYTKSLRGLCYDIKEDDCDTIHKNIHHESVYQTILCESCGYDLLDVGIEEKVWRVHRYDRENRKSYKEICDVCDDPYECSNCGCAIEDEPYALLRKYLDI